MILLVDNVSFVFAEQLVLQNVSFTLKQYDRLAIAGETGSGKSTLLKTIAGLIEPRSGKVFFEGEEIAGPSQKLVPGHPAIAYLSQYFELQKFLRVEQILDYASHLKTEEAAEIVELCEINELLKRKTDELSGGEKQRIGLARLLVGKPRLLLLDEPFSNLDPIHKTTLKNVLAKLSNQLGITCVLASHDPHDTLPWADEIVILRNGTVVQHATPLNVYANPIDEYTAGLFGDYTLLTPELAKKFHLDGSSGVLRPEAFYLSREGVDATVTAVKYFGAYAHVVLDVAGSRVVIHAPVHDVRSGDAVRVEVRKGSLKSKS